MPLFQRAAATEQDVAGRPALRADEVAQLDEAAWRARAFRGDDVPQLTPRAVLTGAALGFVLAATNLYMGLKTPWMSSIALVACLVSFSLWRLLARAGVARTPLSILESNCMQSTASAAGYSTGSFMVSAIPALLLLSVSAEAPLGRHLPIPLLAAWVFLTALLGVAMAVPMKRGMIDRERLRFPSGTAAAVTLQSLYERGEDAAARARALLLAVLVAGVGPLLTDLRLRGDAALLPAQSAAFDWLPARGAHPKTGTRLLPSDWGLVLDHKLMIVGVGMLVGFRVPLAMLLGGVVLLAALGPAALAAGALAEPALAPFDVGVWAGAPLLVAANLVWVAQRWRTVVRAVRGLRDGGAGDARVDVPRAWFAAGVTVAALGLVTLGHLRFGVPWPIGAVALAINFVLCLVACRAAGESDITPAGPLGVVAQLLFGAGVPHDPTANLMGASVTAGSALSSADLLTDLKSGHLLGASPRRQFVAQLCGIVPGTIAMVLAFHVLVPDARPLLGKGGAPPQFPAPSAQQWLAVARLFEHGFGALAPLCRHAIAWGFVAGVALALLEAVVPERARRWVPSPTGVGLGLMVPPQYAVSLLLGASAAWVWTRRDRASAERHLVPVSSGLIAGESIVGVAVAAANNFLLR